MRAPSFPSYRVQRVSPVPHALTDRYSGSILCTVSNVRLEGPHCTETPSATGRTGSSRAFPSQRKAQSKERRIFLRRSLSAPCDTRYALFLYTTSPVMRSAPITTANIHNMSIKCSFRLVTMVTTGQRVATPVRATSEGS